MTQLKAFIVEDSPVIRENLVAALEEMAPIRVVGNAEDETSAVGWLSRSENQCDLVVVDIFLKSGSGLGVLKAATKLLRGRNHKVGHLQLKYVCPLQKNVGDILKNFFAGVWVLIERPFRIGDSIEVTGYVGTVEGIAFRTTQLRTDDGREVIVPNGTFMTSAVVNLTRFPTRRATATLVLPADEKPVTTEDIRSALEKVEGISPQPPPSVELRSVGDGKAQYVLSFWAANRDAALPQALRALRARFPQGDVRSG